MSQIHPDIYRVIQKLQGYVMQLKNNGQQTEYALSQMVQVVFQAEGFFELEKIYHTSQTMDVTFVNQMLNKRVQVKFYRTKRLDMRGGIYGADQPSGYIYMIDVKRSAPIVTDIRK